LDHRRRGADPQGHLDDGRVAVDVHQVARDANTGEVLVDERVRHIFTFRDGLVARFDIEGAKPRARERLKQAMKDSIVRRTSTSR
jgi:hypothetical protein